PEFVFRRLEDMDVVGPGLRDVLVPGPENRLWRQARGKAATTYSSTDSDTPTRPHPRAFARDLPRKRGGVGNKRRRLNYASPPLRSVSEAGGGSGWGHVEATVWCRMPEYG